VSISANRRLDANGTPGGLGFRVVGMPGFEPGASTSRTWRAAKLRYIPLASWQAVYQPVGVWDPSGSGTTNRYPIPGSVSSTCGADGSSSFLRRLAM
jgi:hypothetical protein